MGLKECRCGNGIEFIVYNDILNPVDHRLFGQFLEKASFGEPGPENAVDKKTGNLRPEVEQFINEMKIPVIRFPGGTDVDYSDWTDMIDNVPGREGKRPHITITKKGRITNYFGYDEFLRFADRINTQVILVVNFREALAKEKPLKEAALHAAGLTAYCNAAVGAALPEGMPDWPSVRSRNGHPKPYRVPYFQIGNESWAFAKDAFRQAGIGNPKDQAEWYIECINTYIEMIKAVDPTVKIIADGDMNGLTDLIMNHPSYGNNIDYINYHNYMPWGIQGVFKNGEKVPPENLTPEEIWYAWTTVPYFDDAGKAIFPSEWLNQLKKYRQMGHKWEYAMTEWNWNGWPGKDVNLALNSRLAKGLGAAGYINAFIRAGDLIKIATQSNLIGSTWDIGAVRVKPENSDLPYLNPAGQITTFYGKYHGNVHLKMEQRNVPVYNQPYVMGPHYMSVNAIAPAEKVVMLDAVATADEQAVYFHIINRNFSDAYNVTLDWTRLGTGSGEVIQHVLQGRLNNEPEEGQPMQIGYITHKGIDLDEAGRAVVTLPKRSVSIIKITR
jgi:alpha-N-arabinofuranosidase